MKRSLALVLALLCMFSALLLTSCNESAYKLYSEGVKEFTDAKALDSKMTVSVTYGMGGTTNTTTTTMNVKANGTDFSLTSDAVEVTYVGGVAYTYIKMGELSSKTKETVSAEDAKKLMEEYGEIDSDEIFPTLTEEDLKDVKVEKKGDKRVISASLSDAAVKKLADTMVGALTGGATDGGKVPSVSIKNVEMTASFDKDGHITDFGLKFSMSFDMMGMTATMDMDLKMEINAINGNVTITAPADAADYKEAPDVDLDDDGEWDF